MHMLYNSASYVVVQFDADSLPELPGEARAAVAHQGGFEIVDKFARKEIFIQGEVAEQFKQGVEALIQRQPSEDDIDEFVGRFTALMHQPVILH